MLNAVKSGQGRPDATGDGAGSSFPGEDEGGAATEMFCENLSHGLHAAAQPLTILRARLFMGNIDRMDLSELRELAVSSAVQVERVCTVFGYLQEFVSLESVQAELSAKPILPLLANVVEGLELIFKRDGIELTTIAKDTYQPVFVDGARTSQALSIVLLIMHSMSRGKDSVTVTASQAADGVRLMLENPSARVDEMDADTRMRMNLAEANIRSQHAQFSWGLKPFRVEIELPMAPGAVLN